MWEKETQQGKEKGFFNSWAMILAFALVLVTNFIDALVLFISKINFAPGFTVKIRGLCIAIGVAITGVSWLLIYKKYPLSKPFRLVTSIIATLLCYPINLESNLPNMGISKSLYSYIC